MIDVNNNNRSSSGKRVVYGSSEIMDSNNFLEQLTKLGQS